MFFYFVVRSTVAHFHSSNIYNFFLTFLPWKVLSQNKITLFTQFKATIDKYIYFLKFFPRLSVDKRRQICAR